MSKQWYGLADSMPSFSNADFRVIIFPVNHFYDSPVGLSFFLKISKKIKILLDLFKY